MTMNPKNGWIDVHDALPEPGEYVLIRHKYRLDDYDIPYAIGQRICYHGSRVPRWVWVAGKSHSDGKNITDNPLEWVHAHTLRPGDHYVTHWRYLPEEPKQGIV